MATTYPAWTYLGPQSTLRHNVWAAFVAAFIGAVASASVITYLADYPARGEMEATSPAAIVFKDPAAEAGSAVIQDQIKTEKMPAAVRSDDLSRPNNSTSSSDVEGERSTALQFEQPLTNAIGRHHKTHRPHVSRRYGTPNHW